MSSPIQFYRTFRSLMCEHGIRHVLTSGMACVEYGIQQNTRTRPQYRSIICQPILWEESLVGYHCYPPHGFQRQKFLMGKRESSNA